MKTYLITESNEPLKEGCLTQYGVVTYISDDIHEDGCDVKNFYYPYRFDLKPLKCYEVDDSKCRCDKAYVKVFDIHNNGCKGHTEITDPSELQRIWEAKRGEEPELWELDYYDSYRAWQNFTLEPGVHEVREPASEELKKAMSRTSSKAIAKVLGSDNNFEELLQKELDKLPFEKGLDDGGYNDGQIAGFEAGARWAKELPNNCIDFEKLRQQYFEECVDQRVVKENGYPVDLHIWVNMAPHDLFEWFKRKIQDLTRWE